MREDQVQRYARHVLLPDVGGTGQARLLGGAARVARAEGAGEVALLYLAAAGVGTLVVADRAPVARAGLLYEAGDVGRLRLEAARERLAELNPDVRVVADGDGVAVEIADCADPAAALGEGARAAAAAIRELLR